MPALGHERLFDGPIYLCDPHRKADVAKTVTGSDCMAPGIRLASKAIYAGAAWSNVAYKQLLASVM